MSRACVKVSGDRCDELTRRTRPFRRCRVRKCDVFGRTCSPSDRRFSGRRGKSVTRRTTATTTVNDVKTIIALHAVLGCTYNKKTFADFCAFFLSRFREPSRHRDVGVCSYVHAASYTRADAKPLYTCETSVRAYTDLRGLYVRRAQEFMAPG